MKVRQFLGRFLYEALGQYLPQSYMTFNKPCIAFRNWCGRMMLQSAGKGIGIGRKARISSRVTLGDYSGIGSNCELLGEVILETMF